MSNLVSIGTFPNTVTAEFTRATLEEHGIPAFVDGGSAGTALAYVGSALGGIKLQVSEGDVQRAREVIDSLNDEPAGDPWFCGACQEEVDAGFDVCWSCRKARAVVEGKPAAARQAPEATGKPKHVASTNPYAAPQEVNDHSEAIVDEDAATADDVEAMINRAWRSTVFGITMVPLLFWGTWSLVQINNRNEKLEPRLQARFNRACLLNGVLVAAWVLVIAAVGIFG